MNGAEDEVRRDAADRTQVAPVENEERNRLVSSGVLLLLAMILLLTLLRAGPRLGVEGALVLGVLAQVLVAVAWIPRVHGRREPDQIMRRSRAHRVSSRRSES